MARADAGLLLTARFSRLFSTDSEPPHSSQLTRGLEATLTTLDIHLSDAEKQAAALLKAARRLRRAAREGNVASLPAAIAAAQADAARTGEPFASAAGALGYDVAEAFASGAWLDELAAAAKAAGVVLVRRDGRVTAYPVALRLDSRAQGVRVGRKLERRIRPSFLAAQLKALQQRPERFNARQFLDRLFVLYESKARAEDPEWRPTRPGPGPLVALAELHDQLTVLPAAAADYPQEEFVTDLLRLDRQPDATSGQGHRFELGGSTGRKGAKRLTLKGRDAEVVLALAGIRHIERTVLQHRLLPPTLDDLAACHDKVQRLYSAAYTWPTPPLPPAERTSSRTMRQYIRGWITQWDLRRLDGSEIRLISGSIASDYTENTTAAEPSALDSEEA